ncbi:MAG: hypothetical protein QW502_03215 [Candidatus Bathyarchaeia archaeon]|nr:hypothetical protein [Candidatus Bathyarchaeota archaeon]
MSDSEKMNALDFVINVLREHEKNLDALISKLEELLAGLPTAIAETPEAEEKPEEARKTPKAAGAPVNIVCESWSDFKEACNGAEIITFHQNGILSVKALQGNIMYEYREALPTQIGSLQCGIPVRLQANLDASEIKKTLSRELSVPENRIIKGEMQFPK